MRVASCLAAILLSMAMPLTSAATAGAVSPCPDIDCGAEADSENSAIVGRGGLLLPRSYEETTVSRRAASDCPGCEWQVVPFCVPSDMPGDICVSTGVWCAPDELWMRLMHRVAPDTVWRQAGFVCLTENTAPLSVDDAAVQVRDRFVDRLPQPEPRFQPAGGALVNLAVVFRSGQQEGTRVDSFDLLGMPVEVAATPSWVWDFGDGSTLRTSDAGSRWPDTTVSHVYRSAGSYDVTVNASWSGQFTVDDLGPFDVDGGAVTQDATVEVVVREAPAELVSG